VAQGRTPSQGCAIEPPPATAPWMHSPWRLTPLAARQLQQLGKPCRSCFDQLELRWSRAEGRNGANTHSHRTSLSGDPERRTAGALASLEAVPAKPLGVEFKTWPHPNNWASCCSTPWGWSAKNRARQKRAGARRGRAEKLGPITRWSAGAGARTLSSFKKHLCGMRLPAPGGAKKPAAFNTT